MKVLFITILLCVLAIKIYGNTIIKNVYRPNSDVVQLEGPHWSVTENALYFVDIVGQNVHRLDGETGNVTTKHIGTANISFIITVAGFPRTFVISVGRTLNLLNWDAGDTFKLITVVDLGLPKNRINDGKVDAMGRLWFGTMGEESNLEVEPDQGTLYKVTESNYVNPEVMVRPVSLSNGITWTMDKKLMFYVDSTTRNIDVFDYDIEIGTIKNRRTLFSFDANNITGLPDGLTIDSEDNLWLACFNGGKVIKINSTNGELLKEIDIGVSQVTSVMWGGPDLATLYVTTSRLYLTSEEQPEAGSLFAIENTGSKGLPENQFAFKNTDKYIFE